ncbi:Sperm-associated antigen 6 [Papilio machaon]|uniref:Sperm-associated antigen 6 n=1 Tax=Papilio machaon TaxID=76193 RepID=A0A0N1PGA5_PAPMA|nr:Sperm-associated antigen 6 [Papilio machaon]
MLARGRYRYSYVSELCQVGRQPAGCEGGGWGYLCAPVCVMTCACAAGRNTAFTAVEQPAPAPRHYPVPRLACCLFDTYQKARLTFAQAVADLATRSTNVKCLDSAGALELLRPLVSDANSTVRQCAVVAAARLAEHDEAVARQMLDGGILTTTLENLHKFNVYYKRSALYLIRAIAKHNEELASMIVRFGTLEHIVACMEDFDTQVKENAAWALGYIGKHNELLAGKVVDAGTLPLLVLAFQEPEISLKQITAGALVDLAKHKPEAVVDAGSICHLVRGLDNQDPKLKRSTLCALSAVASARVELAEAAVAGGALPPALLHAAHHAAPVRRAAACLLRDIVRHSIDLAQLVVNTGGCGPLVELLSENGGGARVPACMALGFIAGQSDQLAMAVIEAKAIPALVEILQNNEAEEAEVCAASWTLGHIAKHSPQHSLAVAVANAFPRLLQLYTNPKSSGEVRARALCCLKQALQCCLHRPALEPLLHAAPACVLKYVLAQYAKILPNDARARRLFVSTGALKRIQEIDTVPGTSLKEYINIINSCFPEEIVRYYSPGYSETLLDRVEAYTPQVIFTN